jgi:hypothetical protein
MIPYLAEPPGTEARAVKKHITPERAMPQISHAHLPPLEVEHARRQQDTPYDEGNEKPLEALGGELTWRALPQREPAPGACDKEEKGHTPGKKKAQESSDCLAQLAVLDGPVIEVKGMDGVKQEYPQNSQHAQPVEIV